MPNRTARAAATGLPKSKTPASHFIEDPSALPELYGMTVAGDCLAPLVADGAILEFSKSAPIKSGDLVLIFRRREAVPEGCPQCLVKRLVMAPPPWVSFPWSDHPQSDVLALIVVETLNPHKRFTYRCADILAIHHCIGAVRAYLDPVPATLPAAAGVKLAFAEAGK